MKMNAVDLDERLGQLTPEMVTALCDTVPVGLHDQIEAAHSQAMTIAELIADHTDQSMTYVPRGTVDDWLRLGLLDTFCAWIQGEATTCLNTPTIERPEPVWSAAWKPRAIVCTRCISLLVPADEIADAVCDRCGHQTTGVDAGDPIYCLTVVAGMPTYQAGTCTDCLPPWHQQARTYLRPKVNRRKKGKGRR